MSFRDTLQAAHERIAALEAEVGQLRAEGQRPDALARDELLRRAFEARAEAEREASEARRALLEAHAEQTRKLADVEHERALAQARDSAGEATRKATAEVSRRQLEIELERRSAELEQLRRQSAERIAELDTEVEVLRAFDRALACAHYDERLDGLRAARAAAEATIAEQRAAPADDPIALITGEAVIAAATEQLARLDGRIAELEALRARAARD